MVPEWFSMLSGIMLMVGAVCAVWIAIDVATHRQQMWIMNLVWPTTALYGLLPAVWVYYRYGRLATRARAQEAEPRGEPPPNKTQTPFAVMVGKETLHCGGGCTLGDLCAELLALWFPVVATWVGWESTFPATHAGKILAVWVLDYVFAFVFGIAFQYFTIKPMRHPSVGSALLHAVKADVASLTAWQLAMYGLMAIARFVLFIPVWGAEVNPSMPSFWFTMQAAMLAGFCTAYPVNWWLIRAGIKEKM